MLGYFSSAVLRHDEGQTWANIIDLASKVWGCSFYESAKELAKQYGREEIFELVSVKQYDEELIPIVPVPLNASRPYKSHPQFGYAQKQWL